MRVNRRQQLLGIAAELFADRGFAQVSMAELGAACGISGPALYRHFASKDAMLAEMLVSISEELLHEGRERAAREAGIDRIRSLVRWHVDFALRHQALIVLQDRDWALLPALARERVRSLQRQYVEVWVGALVDADPGLAPERARAMAHAVFGLLNSTPRSTHLPVPQMAALLEDMACAALGADRAGPVVGPAGLDNHARP